MAQITTVLIVEDEALVRQPLAAHLEDIGYRVVQAEDAEEAIGILERRDDVQVVFTDIEMPGSMDGLRLASDIAARWPPIGLLITSGRREVDRRNVPLGSAFFGKPYSYRMVERSIISVLGESLSCGALAHEPISTVVC